MISTYRRSHTKISAEASDRLDREFRESKQSKNPQTKLQIASDAIMNYRAQQTDEPRYILIGYEAEISQLDRDAISYQVCENMLALVKAMMDEPVHVRTEVLKVLPDGRTERLTEAPQLNLGGEA